MDKLIIKEAGQLDANQVGFLLEMINTAYFLSEGNMWVDGRQRITVERLRETIALKELILAYSDNEIVGCIHLEPMNETSFKFKMLVTSQELKQQGIGSSLVAFVEQKAIKSGAGLMQLELLVPKGFEHPDKVFLHNWYTRIGYVKVSEHGVDYAHMGLSKLLKTACVAMVYHKSIC